MEIFEKNHIENLTADFFNADAIRPQPYKIYRINAQGRRFYFTWEDKTQNPEIYFSVTTFIKQTSEESMYLSRWRGTHGNQYCDEYMAEAARYGTLMHIEIGRFVRQGYFDYTAISGIVDGYFLKNNIDPNKPCILDDAPSRGANKWSNRKLYINRLKKDLLCFQQFCADCNFKPLAMELVLKGSEGYATAIDLVGYMDVEIKGFHGELHKSSGKMGLPKETIMKKRVLAIVDFKSGKHFYENHAKQLEACKRLWNENYPDMPVERLYNWSPSDFRGDEAKYKIKDQTDAVDSREFDAYVELGKVKKENQISQIHITEFNDSRIFLGKSNKGMTAVYDIISWIKKTHGPVTDYSSDMQITEAKSVVDIPFVSREESFNTAIPDSSEFEWKKVPEQPKEEKRSLFDETDLSDLPY